MASQSDIRRVLQSGFFAAGPCLDSMELSYMSPGGPGKHFFAIFQCLTLEIMPNSAQSQEGRGFHCFKLFCCIPGLPGYPAQNYSLFLL